MLQVLPVTSINEEFTSLLYILWRHAGIKKVKICLLDKYKIKCKQL